MRDAKLRTALASRENPGIGCAVLIALGAACTLVPYLLFLLIDSTAVPRLSTIIIGACAFLLALLAALRVCFEARRLKLGLRDAILNNACPDCDYSMSGLTPQLKCPRTGRIIAIPPACPECGSRWPTIPAPLK